MTNNSVKVPKLKGTSKWVLQISWHFLFLRGKYWKGLILFSVPLSSVFNRKSPILSPSVLVMECYYYMYYSIFVGLWLGKKLRIHFPNHTLILYWWTKNLLSSNPCHLVILRKSILEQCFNSNGLLLWFWPIWWQ